MSGHAVTPGDPSLFADKALMTLAARFLVCVAVLFGAMVWVGAHTDLIASLAVATAGAATTLMNWSGVAATNAGTAVSVPGRELVVGPDCTGLPIMVLLASLVLAYPVKLSSRLLGVVCGIAGVVIANLLRLVVVAHVSRAPDVVFIAAHDFLFQVGMVAVTICLWSCWLAFARTRER